MSDQSDASHIFLRSFIPSFAPSFLPSFVEASERVYLSFKSRERKKIRYQRKRLHEPLRWVTRSIDRSIKMSSGRRGGEEGGSLHDSTGRGSEGGGRYEDEEASQRARMEEKERANQNSKKKKTLMIKTQFILYIPILNRHSRFLSKESEQIKQEPSRAVGEGDCQSSFKKGKEKKGKERKGRNTIIKSEKEIDR